MEASHKKHRPPVKVAKDEVEEIHIPSHSATDLGALGGSRRRLNCYWHATRRDKEHTQRNVSRTDISGKREIEQLKRRWKDAYKRDFKSTGLRAGDETDKAM